MQVSKGFCLPGLINKEGNFDFILVDAALNISYVVLLRRKVYFRLNKYAISMEAEHNLLDNELFIDNISQGHLKETAMWTKFLAITGYILSISIAIGAFYIGSIFNKLSGMPGGRDAGVVAGSMITIIYLFVAAIAFFMSFFLYRFSVKMQTALKANDQELLNLSFLNLKNYYRFAGIITILYLVILLLALIGGVITAMAVR